MFLYVGTLVHTVFFTLDGGKSCFYTNRLVRAHCFWYENGGGGKLRIDSKAY
jgi:hypothetical protein